MQIARLLVCAALLAAAAEVAGTDVVPPTLSQTPSDTRTQPLKLLYVMEYDCMFDWEPVKLEKGLTDGVLAWMVKLQDRLTVTSQRPLGEGLMVRHMCFTHPSLSFGCNLSILDVNALTN